MNFRLDVGPLSIRFGERKPLNILLVRHGQSQANVDKSLHAKYADPNFELTPLGREQASAAGEFLRVWLSKNPKRPARLYRSDYLRAVQTSDIIIDRIGSLIPLSVRMDERIRELEFGYADAIGDEEVKDVFPHYDAYKNRWREDAKYYSRRLGGESPADVGDRLRHFIGALYRDQEKYGLDTFIVVNHGLTSRVLAKLLLKEDRTWYANQKNPNNCAIRMIRGKTDFGYIYSDVEQK